jgi:hypothetical protein
MTVVLDTSEVSVISKNCALDNKSMFPTYQRSQACHKPFHWLAFELKHNAMITRERYVLDVRLQLLAVSGLDLTSAGKGSQGLAPSLDISTMHQSATV